MDGSLVLAGFKRVDGITESTLFSAVRDRRDVILGTGNDGKILRVTPAGKVKRCDSPLKEVTSLALSPDGICTRGRLPEAGLSDQGKASSGTDEAQYVWAWRSPERRFRWHGLPGRFTG
jgi:hypothetical protein